jgi:hypothetical protein
MSKSLGSLHECGSLVIHKVALAEYEDLSSDYHLVSIPEKDVLLLDDDTVPECSVRRAIFKHDKDVTSVRNKLSVYQSQGRVTVSMLLSRTG